MPRHCGPATPRRRLPLGQQRQWGCQGWCRRGTLTREAFEDAVQDALLWAWERRHCAHILATNFPSYLGAVIRVKLRKRAWRRA